MVSSDVLEAALAAAKAVGADYAEARSEQQQVETLAVRDQEVQRLTAEHDDGWGLLVSAGGGWGFASTAATDRDAIARTADSAVRLARASGQHRRTAIDLSDIPAATGKYATPLARDPLLVPIEERIALLLDATGRMAAAHPLVKVTNARLYLWRTAKRYLNSLGADLQQDFTETGFDMECYAVDDSGYAYRRSFENDMQAGWEYIESINLPAEGERIGREAGELVVADWAPEGPTTAVVGSHMMSLLVHESCGHPTELDRVLGWEAAFAGTSFLMPEMRGHFRYGSEHVNLEADSLTPRGLGTYGWDDEGTPASRTRIIDQGIFSGYLMNREAAAAIGLPSNGCARATSWGRIPIVRMTNLSLLPAANGPTLDELIAGVDDGLYLETPSSWSLDDKRMNFNFSVEMCREIKNGKLGKPHKSAGFQDRTPHFWGSVRAVGGESTWQLWGFPGCAKGEPLQSCHVAHGASPVLVEGLKVSHG